MLKDIIHSVFPIDVWMSQVKSQKVKSILFPQLHKHRTYTWGTETLLGLFVPSFDTYMIILLDNPYAGVTLISKNK